MFRTDPTFYPSSRAAMKAPREDLAYVACLYEGTGSIDPTSSQR